MTKTRPLSRHLQQQQQQQLQQRRKFQKFAEKSENLPKFLKKKVFFKALISYRIVSRKKPSYRINIVSSQKKAYRSSLVLSQYGVALGHYGAVLAGTWSV